MANYPKGKLTVSGAANVLTDFNPSAFYTNNGNYLKFVVYVDWTNSPMLNAYLFSGESEWFTVENYTSGGIYFNMGTGGTGLGQNLATNTQEFEKPMTVILNNGVASLEQDGNTATVSFSALNPTTLTFWRSNNGGNFRGDFCGFEVYSDATTLVHNYIPWEDGNGNPCIVDTTSDNTFYPTGSGYTMSYTRLENFSPSQDTFTFNGNGGTQTFTVEADNAWTCAAPTDFTINPMSGTAGTTTVTITAPSRISTISETITFTDAQSNTFDISISQSVGSVSPNLTLYQGSTTIKKMYHGTDLIYRKLAVSPTLTISGDSFTFPPTSYNAATVVVTSDTTWTYSVSENWLTVTRTNNNLEIVPGSDWDQGSAPRTATITVTADNGFLTKTATITATQKHTNAELCPYVFVPKATETGIYIDTGVYPTVNTLFKVKYIPKNTIGGVIVGFGQNITPTGSTSDNNDYRFFTASRSNYGYWDFNNSRCNTLSLTADSDGYYAVECGNNYIKDINNGNMLTGTTQTSMSTTGVPIYVNLSTDLLVQSLEIFENGTKVYDGHAAFDGTDYGWSDSVSGTFTTQTYGGYKLTGARWMEEPMYVENVDNTTGTLTLMEGANLAHNLEYSTDGSTWTAASSGAPFTLSIGAGEKVYFRGTNSNWRQANDGHNAWDMDTDWKIGGNLLSVINKDDYTKLLKVPDYAFQNAFSISQTLVDMSDANTGMAVGLGSHSMHNILNRSPKVVGCPDTHQIQYTDDWYLIGGCSYCLALTKPFDLSALTNPAMTYADIQALYEGCSSLALAYAPNYNGYLSGSYAHNWLKSVAATGTLYVANGYTPPTADYGCPSGWTLEHYE